MKGVTEMGVQGGKRANPHKPTFPQPAFELSAYTSDDKLQAYCGELVKYLSDRFGPSFVDPATSPPFIKKFISNATSPYGYRFLSELQTEWQILSASGLTKPELLSTLIAQAALRPIPNGELDDHLYGRYRFDSAELSALLGFAEVNNLTDPSGIIAIEQAWKQLEIACKTGQTATIQSATLEFARATTRAYARYMTRASVLYSSNNTYMQEYWNTNIYNVVSQVKLLWPNETATDMETRATDIAFILNEEIRTLEGIYGNSNLNLDLARYYVDQNTKGRSPNTAATPHPSPPNDKL